MPKGEDVTTKDAAIPALMKLQSLPQWVCWRKEERKGKLTKVPYNPRTGQRAASNDPQTWASYVQALSVWEKFPQKYNGIGYMFHGDITGIDLDHCIDEHGQIEPWAQTLIKRLASYTEKSPSETGVHILIHGIVPKGVRRAITDARHPQAAMEMYCEGRYFTVTGKHVEGTPTGIEARQEVLDALYAEITTTEKPMADKDPNQGPHQPVSLGDEQLLQKAVQASNGEKFCSLFYHGGAGYLSASEADMSLCMMLAFWTRCDATRMDQLFRRSALFREKWDSARGKSTYGQETINKAIAQCNVVYDPKSTHEQLEQNVSDLLHHIANQQHQATRNGTRKRKPYQLTPKEVATARVLEYLEMNEYGDGLFFAEVFAGQVCYDHTDKRWYVWDGHYWKMDTMGKVCQLVAGVLGTLYLRVAADLNTTQAELELQRQSISQQGVKESDERISALKAKEKALAAQIGELRTRAKALRSAKRNANVLTFVQSEMGITAERWDTDPWLLAVPNGVLDLHTGTCRDGVPEDYIRTVSPTEWTGLDTPCPRFERFLQEIFEEKPDRDTLIPFLHRLLGYGITGLTSLHVFPIFYGAEGRNGKDTLLATLKAVLGPLVGPVSNDVFLAQDRLRAGGAATPYLCDLQGKRLSWGSETKEGDRLNIAQIKLLTGGGDISTRQLHGHQYSFTPTHKLLLMTNYKPHAEARDKAFWTRAILIEFGMRFVADPKETNERPLDPTLKETLQQERSGILAWLVRGCLAWQKQSLDVPASVQMATGKYRDEEDKILQFIQECCVATSDAYVKAGALFAAYKAWCEENQFGKGMNGNLFGDEIAKRFTKKHTKIGRIYQGIGLLVGDVDQENLFEEGEIGEASVKPANSAFIRSKAASQAVSPPTMTFTGEAGGVTQQVYTTNNLETPNREEKTSKVASPASPSLTVNSDESASQADLSQIETEGAGFTEASPMSPLHTNGSLSVNRCEPASQASLEPIPTEKRDPLSTLPIPTILPVTEAYEEYEI